MRWRAILLRVEGDLLETLVQLAMVAWLELQGTKRGLESRDCQFARDSGRPIGECRRPPEPCGVTCGPRYAVVPAILRTGDCVG